MPLFKKISLYRRKRFRRKLMECFMGGAQVAHLSPFHDRAPRHDLHRACKAAFMRGFLFEQKAMNEVFAQASD